MNKEKYEYMEKYNISENCIDEHNMCAQWALIGECKSNPNFMLEKCKKSCRICQSHNCYDKVFHCNTMQQDGGCYYDSNMKDLCAWTCQACDVKYSDDCTRNVSSRPAIQADQMRNMFNYLENSYNTTVHSRDPWVITVEDFVNADLILENLFPLVNTKWKRSLAGDGEQVARSSSTWWCNEKCRELESIKNLEHHVERIVGVPITYAEPIQFLKYEKNQYYKVHHDQNSPRASAWGPRVYTIFLYLSDVVGGETKFPKLNITITPKKGTALLWPSVLSEDPNIRDDRTDHEALPVVDGIKYSANFWIHLYPFKNFPLCQNEPYLNNWY